MKVTTKLAQLRVNSGNISYEKISESTGINPQQLREVENGEGRAMKRFGKADATRTRSVAKGLSFP